MLTLGIFSRCCEFFASRAAAAVDDRAAVFGLHAVAEAAIFLTFSFAWLVSAFHRSFLKIKFGANISDPLEILQAFRFLSKKKF